MFQRAKQSRSPSLGLNLMGVGSLAVRWGNPSHWFRGRRLLLDKVPKGKHQTLNLKLILAQDTNCWAGPSIF